MSTKIVMAGVFAVLLATLPAMAQEERRQEIGIQGTGFFTRNSTGNGIFQHSTDTGGFVVSYRYHFNNWLAADASYGYIRNTQQNFISSSVLNVQADVHQATGALLVTLPYGILKLHPYVLAGTGALVFDPTGNRGGFVPGATTQARAA